MSRFQVLFFGVCILLSWIMSPSVAPLSAQQVVVTPRSALPGFDYEIAWAKFVEGDFRGSGEDFRKILARRTQTRQTPWLDSICYYTMIGECHFQLGDYPQALEHYSKALELYTLYSDWTAYVRINGSLTPAPRPNTPWGFSKRNNPIGSFPKSFHIQVLWSENIIEIEGGLGVMEQNALVPINAPTIIECIARAIRHRSEILGPLSKFDPLNHKLVDELSTRPGLANNWSRTWVDALYGLALSAAGRDEDALVELDKAVVMPGQIDHQLTPAVLCEMGRIKLRTDKAAEAADLFREASIASYFYSDPLTMEESFRYMAICQRLIDRGKPSPLLVAASNYASDNIRRRGRRWESQDACANPFVLASLLEEVADDCLAMGDLVGATAYLKRAEELLKTTAMQDGRYGTRWNYLQARSCYLSGRPNDFAAGNQFLDAAMRSSGKTSLWVSQIQHLATLHKTGRITTTGMISTRRALDLYEELLREPTAWDRVVQPIDSFAVEVALPLTPGGMDVYELWFAVANELSYKEQTFEISERIRRKRFYGQIPFGSRLHSLRTIFEAPDNALSQQEKTERDKLKTAFSGFAQLSKKSQLLQKRLKAAPTLPKDKEQANQLSSLYKELEETTRLQEMFLRSIALSRAWVPTIFPPLYTLTEIQERLPEESSLLVFFASQGNMYGYMIDRTGFDMWQVPGSVKQMRKPIADYLVALGGSGTARENPAREVPVKNLREDVKRTPSEAKKLEWKQRGNALFKSLLRSSKQANFQELIIVPDHLIWYVPFETLCIDDVDGQLRPFFAANEGQWTLRYAPTAALGIPVKHGHSVDVETLVVAGKLYPKDDSQKSITTATEMKKEVNKLIVLPSDRVPANDALFSKQLNRLVVFNDIPRAREGGLNWNPFGLESRKNSSRLGQWLELPLGGPSLIALPGFQSQAATSLVQIGDGRELFLTALTLQANGAESILLSRWNPGGKMSYDLVETFLKNYQNEPAATAWKQAIFSAANEFVQFDAEPRLKTTAADTEPLRGDHPFFWGGFLLVDRGELKDPQEELDEEMNEEDETNETSNEETNEKDET